MLRTLWLIFVYTAFLGLGAAAPFVFTLGYVWVDTFQPQFISYFFLNQLPVALIMGVAAFGSYILMDHRSPPKLTLASVLQLTMAVWVSMTLIWAVAPDAAWGKWNVVIKTLAFSAFIPLVIRSRAQIEAFTQTYVLSLAANFVPFGLKVLISGGGYGVNLGLEGGNSGLAEGGLLSSSCLMAVPLAVFLAGHSRLLPDWRPFRLGYWALAGLAVVTAIGTYERSALIGLIVLAGYTWLRTPRKVLVGFVIVVVGALILYKMQDSWFNRVSTIGSYQTEDSAFVRLLVWKWTLGFVAQNPLGGGFMAYVIDHVEVPARGATAGYVQFGRAFHSIYFEVLGEHGFIGIGIFLLLSVSVFFKLRGIAKQARRYPELAWIVSLADALQVGLAVFMTSGAFVGIAFQPMFWYFISLSVSLDAYVARVIPHDNFRVAWGRTVQSESIEPVAEAPLAARPAVAGWRDQRSPVPQPVWRQARRP